MYARACGPGFLITLLLVLAVTSCTRRNPAVCCTTEAECATVGFDSAQGCENGLVCVNLTCTMTCSQSHDCSGATPVCGPDGVCVGCTSSDQCSAPTTTCDLMTQTCIGCNSSDQCSDPTPTCDVAAQTCVGCLTSDQCPASAPTCDGTTHTCRACAADADCDSALCDADAGTCIAEDTILYASPTGAATASCGKTDPCSLVHAFDLADATRDTIKLATGAYTASLNIAGKNVTVFGFGATVTAGTTAGAFTIGNTTRVRLVGLDIIDPNADAGAVRCDSGNGLTASVELDQVTVEASSSSAIAMTRCSLTMSRSHVIGHDNAVPTCGVAGTAAIDRTLFEGGGGVASILAGSVVRITNSVFTGMTSVTGAFTGSGIGIGSAGVGSMFVSFSTIIDSLVTCGNGSPACSAGGAAEGSCIDNSIIVNTQAGAPTDTVTGSACFTNYTIVRPQSTALVGVNNKLGVDPLFQDPTTRDYHLKPASPAVDAADPAATDLIDFDGTARPQGTQRDLGAFELKP